MLELVAKVKSGDIDNIENIWIKRRDEIVKNDVRPLEHNLDRYPFQDYDITTHYILSRTTIICCVPVR